MRNLFLFAPISVFFLANVASAKDVAGEIVSVKGTVFIRPDKTTGRMPASPPKAIPGGNVYAGDVINTSSEGGVKILMKDKTIVDIGPSTLFKLDEYLQRNGGNRKAKIDLAFGKLRVAVSKKIQGDGKFEVKTKGATMGVRGTEFIIKEDIPDRLSKSDKSAPADAPKAQKTEITVVQGKVDVSAAPAPKSPDAPAASAPKTVSLTAGTQLTTGAGVPAGAASGPVKVSETQMKSLTTETKIVDNTFTKAVTIEPMKQEERSEAKNEKSEKSEKSEKAEKTEKAEKQNKQEGSAVAENKPSENKSENQGEGGDKGKSSDNPQNGEGRSSGEQPRLAESKDQGGENRAPASNGPAPSSAPSAPVMTAITPMINIALPPVVVNLPPVIDVPGAPVTPFQNNGFRNNVKRVQVTIVRGE